MTATTTTTPAANTAAVVLVPTIEGDRYIAETFDRLREAIAYYGNCISGGCPAYFLQVWREAGDHFERII